MYCVLAILVARRKRVIFVIKILNHGLEAPASNFVVGILFIRFLDEFRKTRQTKVTFCLVKMFEVLT